MAKLDKSRAAEILVDAIYLGDDRAADKWGVTSRTIRRYRDRCAADPELSAFVQQKRSVNEANWAPELARALKVTIRKLAHFVETVDNPTLEAAREIRLLFKDLAEIQVMREVLGAPTDQPPANHEAQARADEAAGTYPRLN